MIIVTINNTIERDASLFLPLTLPLSFFDNTIFLIMNIDSKRNKCEIIIIFNIIFPIYNSNITIALTRQKLLITSPAQTRPRLVGLIARLVFNPFHTDHPDLLLLHQ